MARRMHKVVKPKRPYIRDRKGRFHRCPGSALNRGLIGHCSRCGYKWNDGLELKYELL